MLFPPPWLPKNIFLWFIFKKIVLYKPFYIFENKNTFPDLFSCMKFIIEIFMFILYFRSLPPYHQFLMDLNLMKLAMKHTILQSQHMHTILLKIFIFFEKTIGKLILRYECMIFSLFGIDIFFQFHFVKVDFFNSCCFLCNKKKICWKSKCFF